MDRRSETAEKKVNEFEDIAIETIQRKHRQKEHFKKWKDYYLPGTQLQVILYRCVGVPNKVETVFGEIMIDTFLSFIENRKLQIQNSKNQKTRNTKVYHNQITNIKINHKEKMLKLATAKESLETRQARKQWRNIFNSLKRKKT